jgi:hypothetical protein
MTVYMDLYKATICTVKLHFIYLNDISRVMDIFITLWRVYFLWFIYIFSFDLSPCDKIRTYFEILA